MQSIIVSDIHISIYRHMCSCSNLTSRTENNHVQDNLNHWLASIAVF